MRYRESVRQEECERGRVFDGKYEREKVLDGECVRGRIRTERGRRV